MNQFLESGKLYSFMSRPKMNTQNQNVSVQLKPGIIPIDKAKLQNYQNVGVEINGAFKTKDLYAPPFLNIAPVLQNTGMTQYSRTPVLRRDRIV